MSIDYSPLEAIAGRLVLEVDFAHRRTYVVAVQSFVGDNVLEPDPGAGENVLRRHLIPGVGYRPIRSRTIVDSPDIVFVAVRIQRDLLFYTPSQRFH